MPPAIYHRIIFPQLRKEYLSPLPPPPHLSIIWHGIPSLFTFGETCSNQTHFAILAFNNSTHEVHHIEPLEDFIILTTVSSSSRIQRKLKGYKEVIPHTYPEPLKHALLTHNVAEFLREQNIRHAQNLLSFPATVPEQMRGTFSEEVFCHPAVQRHISAGYDESEHYFSVAGYLGYANRKLHYDAVLEDYMREVLKWDHNHIAFWLTRPSSEQFAANFHNADALCFQSFANSSIFLPRQISKAAENAIWRKYNSKLFRADQSIPCAIVEAAKGSVFRLSDQTHPKGKFSDEFWEAIPFPSAISYLQHPYRLAQHDALIEAIFYLLEIQPHSLEQFSDLLPLAEDNMLAFCAHPIWYQVACNSS